MRHISSLHHLLVSLKRKQFSYQIGNLMSASSIKYLKELKDIYSTKWKDNKDVKTFNKLEKNIK